MTAPEDFSLRAQLHRAVDQICDAHPHAKLDARARGFPAGGTGTGSGGDPTGTAALAQRVAEVWLAYLDDLRRRVFHQADRALALWPKPPSGGQTVGDITVGARHNQVEVCWKCGEPAPSGRDANGLLLIHRVPVGNTTVALHATTCYFQLDRKARAAGTSLGTYLATAQTAQTG